MNTQLSSLQAGDEVIYHSGSPMHRFDEVVKIHRVTKTQIVILSGAHEVKFRRDNGRRIANPDRFYFPKIYLASPEKKQAIRDERERLVLRKKIKDGIDKYSLAQLRAAMSAIKSTEEKEKSE